jgi:hypothetical protein
MLLGSISLCSRLKDLQQSHSHPKKKQQLQQPVSRASIAGRQLGDMDRVVDDVDANAVQIMEAGEHELLDIVREGMQSAVAARHSSHMDANLEGWSVGDLFFSQVNYYFENFTTLILPLLRRICTYYWC